MNYFTIHRKVNMKNLKIDFDQDIKDQKITDEILKLSKKIVLNKNLSSLVDELRDYELDKLFPTTKKEQQ